MRRLETRGLTNRGQMTEDGLLKPRIRSATSTTLSIDMLRTGGREW
jgi:hypothetical protein